MLFPGVIGTAPALRPVARSRATHGRVSHQDLGLLDHRVRKSSDLDLDPGARAA